VSQLPVVVDEAMETSPSETERVLEWKTTNDKRKPSQLLQKKKGMEIDPGA
jgi:hypothetical protein